MKSKRGAIELSITTIIVIVIGITILILGLGFVSGTFGKITIISDKIFETTESQIDKLLIASKFSMPSEVSIEQGSVKVIKATVGHDGTIQGPAKFEMYLTPDFPAGITEQIIKAKVISLPRTINEGEQITFSIKIAAAAKAPITVGDSPSYSVLVKANGQDYESSAFVISVIKGRGIFGF
ncbi:hypothetical protein J4409_03035 [Candidatus Woesearchaeota archaeon]|nr:hypothetical protein [Candidatus Woesearchaeota archaeon]